MDEAFEAMEPDGLKAEADAEVDKILQEITQELFSKAAETPMAKIQIP